VSRRRHRDETGASLLLVLIFVTVIGLITGTLLGFGSTGLATGVKIREKTVDSYDTAGALDTAINKVRNSTTEPVSGTGCVPDELLRTRRDDGSFIVVDCSRPGDLGAPAGTAPQVGETATGPSLVTLGTVPGEEGIRVGADTVLRTRGRVSSASTIDGVGPPCTGSSTSNCSEIRDEAGPIVAGASCFLGRVTLVSDQGVVCGGIPEPDPGVDPATADAFAQPASQPADLVYRNVPTSCSAPVTFQPGYYDDGAALSKVFATCGATTYWFQPGVYFFDFHNDSGDLWAGPSHVWTIKDAGARVVAGTPQGWNPNPAAFTAPTIPGSCVGPQAGGGNGGAEFVFGGDSQLSVTAGQVEVCGRFNGGTRPPFAIYGARTGDAPLPAPSPWLKTDGTGTDLVGNLPFMNPADITEIGGASPQAAEVTLAGTVTPVTGTVVVKGFASASAIPAGSILTSAVLRVSHRDAVLSGGGLQSISVGVTPNGTSAITHVAVPTYHDPASGGAYHVDDLDITSALQAQIHSHGYSGLMVRYDATLPEGPSSSTVSEYLDSIQLQLTYQPPSLRSEDPARNGMLRPCVATGPYVPGTSNCALMSASGTNTGLYLQGNVYAPMAAMDLQLANVSAPVFGAGAVLRSLRIAVSSVPSFAGPMVGNAFTSPPLNLYLRVYVCPSECGGSTPPSSPWQLTGLAQVSFSDTTFLPTAGHRQVTVRAWQLVR
jgi:hypothetical protein